MVPLNYRSFLLTIMLLGIPCFALEFEDLDFQFGFDVKGHYRYSEDTRFRTGVPPNHPFLPPLLMNSGFPPEAELRTVDPGHNVEVSTLTLFSKVNYLDVINLNAKVDFIDKYDRNSTSDDKDIDVDELWLRLGREIKHGKLSEDDDRNLYAKIGKFGKFERQNDRHLESYGLSSTAFNRFEDVGIELGVDVTSSLYLKGSWTSGNPVFIRDPNALAGDHGTSKLFENTLNPDPDLNAGIVVLYDSEVEDFDFHEEFSEWGLGLGYRIGNEEATRTIDIMAFGYERDLKGRADLFGTHYGGDLDVFDTPAPNPDPNNPILADGALVLKDLEGDYKREYGFSLWMYFDDYTFFGQFVTQDIGGLKRKAWELEFSHKYYLPEDWTFLDKQFIQILTPVFRYSRLDPQFKGARIANGPEVNPLFFPSSSVFWDWEKIDIGVRIGMLKGLDLTVEYAFNEFVRGGRNENADEMLATLRWRHIF